MRRKYTIFWVAFTVGLITLSACVQGPTRTTNSTASNTSSAAQTSASVLHSLTTGASAPTFGYEIVKAFPHNPLSYTEGFMFQDGTLFESTGGYGQSEVREVNLETGRATKLFALPKEYFGEGLTVYQNTLLQLTWQSEVGFIYDIDSLALEKVFSYRGEGWGITFDGQRLIVSDGSSNLQFWNPQTLSPTGSVQVTDQGRLIHNLNELEYIQGQIYANIWQTDRVAIINPQDGRVSAWLDLSGLLQTTDFRGQADVLNGIAYDQQNERLFVTGKLWPYLFQIKLRNY
jgi:glutaminyl-peptide cyclotransferase